MADLPAEDRKTQMPGLIMAAIYRALLDEIETDGCHVLKHGTACAAAQAVDRLDDRAPWLMRRRRASPSSAAAGRYSPLR